MPSGPFPASSVPVGNPLEPAPPATAELQTADVVRFLLDRADSIRGSWVDPHGSTVAADALVGAAHDLACGCEDSTVAHLREWLAAHA